jgi:predicted O-methyltransferase YrrM
MEDLKTGNTDAAYNRMSLRFRGQYTAAEFAAWVDRHPGFDLAFIDGNHRFDRVFLDLWYVGRLVRRGGLVVLDDYDLPGVAKAASFFLTNLAWTLEEPQIPSVRGRLAALRTSQAEDQRPFTYFEDF